MCAYLAEFFLGVRLQLDDLNNQRDSSQQNSMVLVVQKRQHWVQVIVDAVGNFADNSNGTQRSLQWSLD